MTKEQSQQYFDSVHSLEPKDIAGAVLYVLGTPPHVQVSNFTSLYLGIDVTH
jgi:NADP-dependent 3-hydroxy acid dehydrogenase YdfG